MDFDDTLLLQSMLQRVQEPGWEERANVQNWAEDDLRAACLAPLQHEWVNGLFMPNLPVTFSASYPTDGDPMNAGVLFNLGHDVLHLILMEMDLLMFERVAQTCRYLRGLAYSEHSFQVIMRWLPTLRDILCGMGVMYWISIRNIVNELYYPLCRACHANGVLLFFPTCERVCYNCLRCNPAYRCVTIQDAMRAFALTIEHLKRLPVMDHSYMEQNIAQGALRPVRRLRKFLVPVKSALKYAVKIHGSREKVDAIAHASFNNTPGVWVSEQRTYQMWRKASIGLPDEHSTPFLLQYSLSELNTRELGRGFIWLPLLHRCTGEEIKRYHCRGCKWVSGSYLPLTDTICEYLDINPNLDYHVRLQKLAQRANEARSWEEMLQHVPNCPGVLYCGWSKYRSEMTRAILHDLAYGW